MREQERLQYYRDRIKSNPQLEQEIEENCDFILADEEVLKENLDYLLERGWKHLLEEGNEESRKIVPFATDASEGVYVLVYDDAVAYISTERQAGYVACCVDDFYKILLNCGCLVDYLSEDVLGDEGSFCSVYDEIKSEIDELECLDDFLEEEELQLEPDEIYDLFKQGVSIAPPFVLEPMNEGLLDDEMYLKSDNLFGMAEKEFLKFIGDY